MRDAFSANSLDLLHYFERRVTPPEDAADLLSETMLIAWRKVSDLPSEPEPARMWLFTTARYVLLNYQRGKRRQNDLANSLREQIVRTHSSEPSPQTDLVIEGLAELPQGQREILRLVHWDRFTVEEASRLLHLSRATGRRHYNKAIDALRDVIYRTAAIDSASVSRRDAQAARPVLSTSRRRTQSEDDSNFLTV